MAKSDALKTATVLAFERKLDPSDALFHAGQWEHRRVDADWPAITLREKSVRGTISNRLKAKDQDPAKLDAKIQNPNLQTVDVATLPPDADTLMMRFTLRVLGGAGTPSACNSAAYQEKLHGMVRAYVDRHGFGELARRYAHNLANARFLWRNRIGAEDVEVHVRLREHGEVTEHWTFDALDLSLRDFTETDGSASIAKYIARALAGERHLLLEVIAFARIGAGQEVFPSQELILERASADKKSKTLYHVDGVAAMHSQKIGNALRTVDTWYPVEQTEDLGPIAVEPYGSVTTRGTAYRPPKTKTDFYSLLDGWVIRDQEPAEEQQHFVMATLIRGGVFGEGAD